MGYKAGFWGSNEPFFFIFPLRVLISLDFFPSQRAEMRL